MNIEGGIHEAGARRWQEEKAAVTVDDLRRALAKMTKDTKPNVPLDPRLLETLARDLLSPRGEAFEHEKILLCGLVHDLVQAKCEGEHDFATETLGRAVLAIGEEDGTPETYMVVLRAVAAFLLQDWATGEAVCMKSQQLEEGGAS